MMNLLANSLISTVGGIVDKLIPDKALNTKLNHQILMAIHSSDIAQMEVNKEEAKHANIFVSGWRPFIGWASGISIAYHAMIQPVLEVICRAFGLEFEFPHFDLAILYPVLLGMLGLTASRSFEKMKGVAR